MDPVVFAEEFSNTNQGTTSQSEESVAGNASLENLPVGNESGSFFGLESLTTNVAGNASLGNLPVDNESGPFFGLGSLTKNVNFEPSIPVSNYNDQFLGTLVPEPNQGGANFPCIEQEDWFKAAAEEEDEAFNRLMEMSSEDFEKMMSEIPDGILGPSSATSYAISNKRARRDEEEFGQIGVENDPVPQPAFEPQQMNQIRQIREVKSRRGKVIEVLQKKVQDLEADLVKSRAEVNDAFENGRMMTLLGLNNEWEAKEAILKDNANSALTHQQGQLEEAKREIVENNEKLDQYRAQAETYEANFQYEAGRYKQAAQEEFQAQSEAVTALEGAKNFLETQLSEQTRVLDLAKLDVESLGGKVAGLEGEKAKWEAAERLRKQEQQAQPTVIGALEGKIKELEAVVKTTEAALEESEQVIERLDGAATRTEGACADQKKLLDKSQSYAKDLEKRIADLEREQSSKEVAQRRREEELERSGTETCKALEGKINELEINAEKATRAQENSVHATKSLNDEINRLSEELAEVQLALKTKANELETAQAALKEQVKAQNCQKLRDSRSVVVGPVEQVNIEPSCLHHAFGGTKNCGTSFTFDGAEKLFPPSHIGGRKIHPKKSRRQKQSQPQHQPVSQTPWDQEPEPESKRAQSTSQLGMFSHQFYPTPVPANNRPRRSQIHVEQAIRNRLHIPLGKVHKIVSRLDKIGDWQDEMTDTKAGLVISAELTGLSIDDLRVMQKLRSSIPSRSSSRNPRYLMNPALVEIPRTLVDLLATDDRPAISAFLDGASYPQRRRSNDITREVKSQGTQTELSDAEAKMDSGNVAVQEEVAVAQPSSSSSPWKIWLIFSCLLLWLVLPLLMPLPWSSPVDWIFEEPDPNSGWLDSAPKPSPWYNLLPDDFSRWPIISNFIDFFFERPDLESKWCGNIPVG